MSLLLLQLFNGISVSSILLLVALGLAITFGLMNIINMAHGELIMIGAYTAYMTQQFFQKYVPEAYFDAYFLASIPLAFALAFGIGWLLETLLVRHLYKRPLDSLIATWGVSLILQQLARTIFGAPNKAVKAPSWLEGGITLTNELILPYKRLFIIGLVALCLVVIYLYLYRSRGGRNMRAAMQNRQMAACLGVSTRRLDAQAFAFGSGIAGIAGCAIALLGPIGPALGTYYIVDAFMVVVLGGIGKLVGSLFGALSIGVLNTAFEYATSATVAKVIVFTLIIAFLQWKPSGLVSVRSRSLD
ncbi:urea ABC transporter permease subunit UrtB [Paenibacillus thermoaerophilus]|uniref:Urea ABC transporter permease subunit UrtB n=1 Tax=Paenibacillus thermoaerophilus TaxID=1215385 RepID=A0ABW2V547_9BACL|nr:urea ABC transporter permease subunit UrtB [Paenibacillus thermoaerophilus]TMV18450.1 urea ABC transporter permease subunit UrtB [Paenibacillus thermoaerophilus]